MAGKFKNGNLEEMHCAVNCISRVISSLEKRRKHEAILEHVSIFRKSNVKSESDKDAMEKIVLKFLKEYMTYLEKEPRYELVVALVEMTKKVLQFVRLSPPYLPELIIEKVLIHLSEKLFTKGYQIPSSIVLKCLAERLEELGQEKDGQSYQNLLPSVIASIGRCLATLEGTANGKETNCELYLNLLSVLFRMQALCSDVTYSGLAVKMVSKLRGYLGTFEGEGEMLARILIKFVCNLSWVNWSGQMNSLRLHAALYVLFHTFTIIHSCHYEASLKHILKRMDIILNKSLSSENCAIVPVWSLCVKLFTYTEEIKSVNQINERLVAKVISYSQKLQEVIQSSTVEPLSAKCLLDQLDGFMKQCKKLLNQQSEEARLRARFLYALLEVSTSHTQLLHNCRSSKSFTNRRTLIHSLVQSLYASIEHCHHLVSMGEGIPEILLESSSVAMVTGTSSEDIECMQYFRQLQQLYEEEKSSFMDGKQRQYLSSAAVRLASTYTQQMCLHEAAILLQLACKELLLWCQSVDNEEEVSERLEECKFLKKVSQMILCKRKSQNDIENVFQMVTGLLKEMEPFLLESSDVISSIVTDWTKINGDLEFSMQRSVSGALDSIPNLDPILKLEWLKAELKQCQSCRKVGVQIQLPVLEEMRSIYSNMCGDDAILMQADVMVEMARLKRGSDDESAILLNCQKGLELLENAPDGDTKLLLKGKALFWKSVILHESLVRNMAEAGDDCGMETSSVSVISEGQARLLHSCEAVEVFTEAVLCWKMVEKDELLVDEDMLELWSSALVLAHLQQWTQLQFELVHLLLRHSSPSSLYYKRGLLSLLQVVTSLPYCFKGEANFLSAFYEEVDSDKEVNSFEVNLALNILSYLQLAHVGQAEGGADSLLLLLDDAIFDRNTVARHSITALVKSVTAGLIKTPQPAPFNPSAYLEHLLKENGVEVNFEELVEEVTHYVPTPSHLLSEATHILKLLMERCFEYCTVDHSPSANWDDDSHSPSTWFILQSFLQTLDKAAEEAVLRGNVEAAKPYISQGLSASESYGLLNWYVAFLQHLITCHDLSGNHEVVESLLNLMTILIGGNHGSRTSMKGDATMCEEVPARRPVNEFATLLFKGRHFYQTAKCHLLSKDPMSSMISEYKSEVLDCFNNLDLILKEVTSLISPEPVAPKGRREKTKSIVSLRPNWFLSQADLTITELCLQEKKWTELVSAADEGLSHSEGDPPREALFYLLKGIALYHQSDGSSISSEKTSIKRKAVKQQKRRKAPQEKATLPDSTSNPLDTLLSLPHFSSFLRAHYICCHHGYPSLLIREVCSWLCAVSVGKVDELASLFACQKSNPSFHHCLEEKHDHPQTQNSVLPVVNALLKFQGKKPKHLPLEKKIARLGFSSVSTCPRMRAILRKFPKEWVFCSITTSPADTDHLITTRLYQDQPPVVRLVPGWTSLSSRFDKVQSASLKSMEETQRSVWRKKRISLDHDLKDSQKIKIKKKTKTPRITDEEWNSQKRLSDPVEKKIKEGRKDSCIFIQSSLQVLLEEVEDVHLGVWKTLLFGMPLEESCVKLREKGRLSSTTSIPSHMISSLQQLETLTEEDLSSVGSHFELSEKGKSLMMSLHLDEDCDRGHVVLITDRFTEQFPWECLPSNQYQPFTRMPSLLFAVNQFIQFSSLQVHPVSKVFYLLNPQGNLRRTQQMFSSWFRKLPWEGYTGEIPDKETLIDGFQSSDLFVYIGHGGGQQLMTSRERRRLHGRAVSVLMGCKSCKLDHLGELDETGIALDHLLTGSPTVIGNLWSITDKDIDRYTKCFLERITSAPEECSLQHHVTITREACDLHYLTGAAPVVYGLPLTIINK